MTPTDILAAARLRVLSRTPYYAAALLAMRPRETPGLGTFAVSADWVLFWDPAAAERWGVPGTAAVLVHELGHLLRDHAGRRGDRDRRKWNDAGDAAINGDLIAGGWVLPDAPILPEHYGLPAGRTAEEYYGVPPPPPPTPPTPPPQGPGQDNPPAPGTRGGSCGGCVTGETAGGGLPTMQQDLARRAVAEAVRSAAGSGRGDIPAGLRAWADLQMEPPRVDWRRRLASLVRGTLAQAAGGSDYSYARPSRRSAGMALAWGSRVPVLPSLRRPVPEVAIVLDTSGSMLGEPLRIAAREVLGIARATGAPVRAYACDSAVHAVARIFSARDLEKINKGGGGTDMGAGIAAAARRRPDVVIVITDGDTPWPADRPRARVVAAVLVGGQKPPEWAIHVEVPR